MGFQVQQYPNIYAYSVYNMHNQTVPQASVLFPQTTPPATDSVNFGNSAVPQKEEKSFLDKYGLPLLAVAGVAVGAVLTKGKLWGKVEKSVEKGGEEVVQKASEGAIKAAPKATKTIHTQPIITDVSELNFQKLPSNSYDDAMKDFYSKRASAPNKVAEQFDIPNFNESYLFKHNYGQDDSLIGVTTRTLDDDFSGKIINIKGNSIASGKLANNPVLGSGQGQVAIDSVGDYLIQHLDDGKKIVSLSVGSGRFDKAGRPIRVKIDLLSNSTEFTPLQKDMIDIISHRKNIEKAAHGHADILSVGCMEYKVGPGTNQDILSYYSQSTDFDVYKDALLSSIATAKKQLVTTDIDNDFVQKALNLPKGERVSKFGA